jgi:hypothetical protein
MLWRKSPAETAGASVPAAPPVAFDVERFRHHFSAFMSMAGDEDAGPAAYVAALDAKHERIRRLIDDLAHRVPDDCALEIILADMFTARRRLFPALTAMGHARVRDLVQQLVSSRAPPDVRLQAIVDAVPSSTSTDREHLRAIQRVRRAAWDFGAELIHFSEPQKYPLMCRWVWDPTTQSGALREFAEHNQAADVPGADSSLATFQALSEWICEQLRTEGIYRDFHWWVDLLAAQGYVGYLGAATQGHFGADFARGAPPKEQLRKLLGIDARRASGRSRVNRDAARAA